MTLEQYATIADVVGVVLIVASLVYVARQLHQTTEMLKSESRQSLVANDQTSLQIGMEHRDLFELLSKPEPLSFQDQFRFSMLWALDMRNREHEYFQYKAGVLDEETWLAYREVLRISFDNPRGRNWWDRVGREIYDRKFGQMVDKVIADMPLDDTYTKLGTWE